MKDHGLQGSRARRAPHPVPGSAPDTRPDLVERELVADAPDRLWVAAITYRRTYAGWVYTAFVLDVFSRRVVGWQLSTSLRTDLALNALSMGLWTRSTTGTTPTRWCTTPVVKVRQLPHSSRQKRVLLGAR